MANKDADFIWVKSYNYCQLKNISGWFGYLNIDYPC